MTEESSEYRMISGLLNCILISTIIALAVISCSKINKVIGAKDDWVVEEIIESVIEKELNMSVDLTPLTPE